MAYDRKPDGYGAKPATEQVAVSAPPAAEQQADAAEVSPLVGLADKHPEIGDLNHYPREAFAGPGRRFGAFLLDCLILMPTMLIVSWVLGTFPGQNIPDAENVGLFGLSARHAKLVTKVLQLVLYDTYFAVTLYRWGGSWGQKFSGIGVLQRDLTLPTKRQARGRYWATALSALCFGLGFLPIFTGRHRRAWHDSLSGTYVVNLTHMPGPVVHVRTRRAREKSESESDARAMETLSLLTILLVFAPGLSVIGLFAFLRRKLVGAKKN